MQRTTDNGIWRKRWIPLSVAVSDSDAARVLEPSADERAGGQSRPGPGVRRDHEQQGWVAIRHPGPVDVLGRRAHARGQHAETG